MIEIIAKWTIILFGLFFISVGFLMLMKPQKARDILKPVYFQLISPFSFIFGILIIYYVI